MTRICSRIAVGLLALVALCTLMTPALAAPSTNYKLTGNEIDDIIAVASAQTDPPKRGHDFGFSESDGGWCGKFISWCAKKARVSCVPTNITGGYSAINNIVSKGLGEFYCFSDSKTNTPGTSIYNYLRTDSTWALSRTALSHVHEVSRSSFVPQKGDIIIFLWSDDFDPPQFSHVGLVRSDYDGRGTVYTVEGNTTGGIVKFQSRQYSNRQIVGFVRPNYEGKSSDSTTSKIEYFDCNVQIQCKSGKVVNLYDNPGDSSRTNYFSRAQAPKGDRGAKLSDGSTWYRVWAEYPVGVARTYWLKYESSKMTVKNLNNSTSQTKPVTIKFSTSSIALDMTQKRSQRVTLTVGGNPPTGCKIGGSMSNTGIVSFDWGDYESGMVFNPTLTAVAPGTTTLTCYIINSSGKKLAETSLKITVTEPSKVEYFNCNVEIDCINGKTVNLYNNPGDSSREDYFSKGQTVPSQYGAKLSDGSTWYRVTVNSAGTVKTLWLKYESSKMTVKEVQNTPATYTVKYDANGGSGAPSTQTKTEGKALILSSSEPTRSGYTFKGWATSISGSVQYNPGGRYTSDRSVTLYAVWSKNASQPEYFSCNVQIDCISGKTVNLYNNPGDDSREDYFSKGQSVTSQCGARLDDGSTWYRVTVNSAGTVKTLWLKYESSKMTVKEVQNIPATYTVKYDANGGSGAPSAQTKIHEKNLVLSSGQPVRSGYTFSGWATSPNGSVQYQPESQYTANQDVTLYAVWSPQNSVTLTLANSAFNVEAYDQFALNFSYTGDVKKVTYDIGNESVCIFDYTDSTSKQNGKTNISMVFKARSAGTTSISINLLDGKGNIISSKKASVTVSERAAPPVLTGGYESNLGLSSLEVGESHVFWIKGTYSDGTVRDVTDLCKVSSSDTNILAINGHTILAENVGTAQIFVTYPEGLTLLKTISVVAAPEEKEPF